MVLVWIPILSHEEGAMGSSFTGREQDKTADLNSVISTALSDRPPGNPNYAAENLALMTLVQALATSPDGILQTLVETALTLCHAHSAGISLLDDEGKSFLWPAIAGQWASYTGGDKPRSFGPWGTVLDRNEALLFSRPERYFTDLVAVTPSVEEVLLIPLNVAGTAVGTLWVMAHDAGRRFNSEDLRVLTSMSNFAALAFQALRSRDQFADKIRSSAERFQAAAEAISDIIWTNNASGEMVGEQPAWGEFTGQSQAEYQGYGWAKAVHPEDAQPTVDEWTQCVADKRTFLFQHRVRRSDGEYRLCNIKAVPILDQQGDVREWVGVHSDVTDAKIARDAILQNEERYRDLISVITDIAWTADAEGRIVVPQPGWATYTGQTWEQYRNFGWANAIHPENREPLLQSWAVARDNRQIFESQGRLWCGARQAWRHFRVKAVPRLNADGSLREWVGATSDVEEETRAEAAAKAAAEKFRFLAESMPQKVFTAKPNGDVDYFNPQWTEFTGLSFEQIRDWGWTQFIHPQDLEENVRVWKHSIATGEPLHFEHRLRRADGVYRWHLSRARALRDADGAIVMWTGSNTDIHEHKLAEEALERRVEERAAAVRQLSLRVLTLQDEEHRKIARELHDSVGQHLASMKMILDGFQPEDLPLQKWELLSQVSKSVDICSSETRTISYLLHPPLLDEMGFQSAARWYAEGFSERSGIQVQLELAEGTPRLPRAIELPLFRVLQACLSNVHRHAKSAKVSVTFKMNDAKAWLEVRDYGKGIDPESLKRFQSTGVGSGIGLAGMQERMHELGGKLEVKSGGDGTLVRAVVPLPAQEVPGLTKRTA